MLKHQQRIFEQGVLVINRRIITAAICSTDRILYDPISHTEQVEAKLDDNDGRLVLFPPKYPQGLKPGTFRGNQPVLRKSDFTA